MSLPFVTKGKPCPDTSLGSSLFFKPHRKKKNSPPVRGGSVVMSSHGTNKKRKSVKRSQPPWRPPPCKFENRIKKTGTYCSICAPSYREDDSLENLKDLNSSIHRLDEEIRRQKGKVLNDLLRMNNEQEEEEEEAGTWRARFSKEKEEGGGLVCTCNLNYQSLGGHAEDKSDGASIGTKSSQSTNINESLKKGMESDSSSSSSHSRNLISSSFKKGQHPKRRKKRKKTGALELTSRDSFLGDETDSKVLKKALIQLRNENESLKSVLSERESKLREAGKKIEEILEQNSILTQRLKDAIFKGNVVSSNEGGPPSALELKQFKYNHPKESYQKELSLLRQKLSDSQIANRNLETYIEYLKKSYVSVFGSVVTSG